MGNAEDFSFVRILPPSDICSVFALHGFHELKSVNSGRHLDGSQYVSRALREEFQPDGLNASPGGITQNTMVLEEFFKSDRSYEIKSLLLLDDERNSRRPRRCFFSEAFSVLLGIEVEFRQG